MIPTNRVLPHPGELLKKGYLDELHITQKQLAEHTGMPLQRVNEIVNGKRGITAETAWLLGMALGMSPEFWMNAQAGHDLTKHRPAKKITRMKEAA